MAARLRNEVARNMNNAEKTAVGENKRNTVKFLLSTHRNLREAQPVAPLPAVISTANKIFFSNGGGSNLAFDAFYAAMKDWGRYQIVGSPDEADLVR
jgi:hypothetical protein